MRVSHPENKIIDFKTNIQIMIPYLYVFNAIIMLFSRKCVKGTDHVGTFMGLKCVVYYANYRSGNQSSKIQVVP